MKINFYKGMSLPIGLQLAIEKKKNNNNKTHIDNQPCRIRT